MSTEEKMKAASLATIGILICVLAFALPVTSAAEIVIDDASAYPGGDTRSTSITIFNAENAGTIDLNLSYEPNVVRVIDVTKGDFISTDANLGNTGFVRIGASHRGNQGLNGTVTVANIELEAVGDAGSTSPLNIEINEFRDLTPQGTDIQYTISNGEFTVKLSKGDEDSGDGGYSSGGGGSSRRISSTKPTEKPPAVSGEEKAEVAEKPSSTLAPAGTPSSAAPAQTPSATIPSTAFDQKQPLMLVIVLMIVSIMAIIMYVVFKLRKG